MYSERLYNTLTKNASTDDNKNRGDNMELYRDLYGCHACIRRSKSGAARLTIRNSNGKLILAKDYTSYRGAKIAMGRFSDCWIVR